MDDCVGKKEKHVPRSRRGREDPAELEGMRIHKVEAWEAGHLTFPWGSLGVTSISWSPVMRYPGLEIVWKVLGLVSVLMEDHRQDSTRGGLCLFYLGVEDIWEKGHVVKGSWIRGGCSSFFRKGGGEWAFSAGSLAL